MFHVYSTVLKVSGETLRNRFTHLKTLFLARQPLETCFGFLVHVWSAETCFVFCETCCSVLKRVLAS